jgi:hypothetical protein
MYDLVELQRKLTENRNLQIEQQQQSINARQYRLRTAAVEKERAYN